MDGQQIFEVFQYLFMNRVCVYWPAMYEAIEREVKKCPMCNKYSKANQKEPVLPHEIPNCPWEKLSADYFTFAGKDYLLVADYFSKYPEVIRMKSKTADATVKKLKQIFSRHSIPNTLVVKELDFLVVTSSPNYPQSNGLIERNVQTIKNLLKKSKEAMKDEQLALLEFRNANVWFARVSSPVADESKIEVNPTNDIHDVRASCQCKCQREIEAQAEHPEKAL